MFCYEQDGGVRPFRKDWMPASPHQRKSLRQYNTSSENSASLSTATVRRRANKISAAGCVDTIVTCGGTNPGATIHE
jgi:hypothetical protein